jgi:hypothetical protein
MDSLLRRPVSRLPRWAAIVVALACVVGGVVLIFRPFTSVEVLVVLAAVNAVLTGALMLTAAEGRRSRSQLLVGLGWIVLGIVLFTRLGIGVDALAVIVLADARSTATTGAWPSPPSTAGEPRRGARQRGPRSASWPLSWSLEAVLLQGKRRGVRDPRPLGAGMDSSVSRLRSSAKSRPWTSSHPSTAIGSQMRQITLALSRSQPTISGRLACW